MPLIFMAGGMLDRFGAIGLPGRCDTITEARQKIQRVLSEDRKLISDIKQSQGRLLEPMKIRNMRTCLAPPGFSALSEFQK